MIGHQWLDNPDATGGRWPDGVARALDWYDRATARGTTYDDEGLVLAWDVPR